MAADSSNTELTSLSTSSWTEWECVEEEQDGGGRLEDPFPEASNEEPSWDPFGHAHQGPPTTEDVFSSSIGAGAAANAGCLSESSNDSFVRKVFKTCFEVNTESNEGTLISERAGQGVGPLAVEKRFLQTLHKSTISLSLSDWSHSLLKDQLLLVLMADSEGDSRGELNTDLDLSQFEPFDWTQEQPTRTVAEGEEERDSDDENVSFSPDLMQGLMRSSTGGLDSPVEFEFDRDKATLGLSMLTIEELVLMRDEMAAKVTRQSDELITLLQKRDAIIRETDTKNKFIAALLRVKDHKQASINSSSSSSSLSTLSNSVSLERPSSEERSRLQSRRRSLSQNLSRTLSLAWNKSKKVSVDEKNSEAYLHVVVPYRRLEETGSFSVPLLKQWIEILKAMAQRSPHLPSLISAYLQSEVLDGAD